MVARRLVTLVTLGLVLASGLAGCLGAEDAGSEGLDADGRGNTTDEEWERMPDNRSGDFAAFRETNATEDGSGGHAHAHDYWEGRTRVSLFEATAEMPPRPTTDGSEVVFRPPPPALVYEGTAYVEITIQNPERHFCYWGVELDGEWICSSNPDHWGHEALPSERAPEPRGLPAMEVSYIHGASDLEEWIPAGTIEWDSPFRIAVEAPMWTDMPHATASLWAFKFETSEPLDNTLTFDVTMDIVRDDAEEIPLWPGHPDFYADRSSRRVHEGSGLTRDEGLAGSRHAGIVQPHFEPVHPERLISYGTRTLHVWANVTKLDSPGGEPANWFIMYKNATRQGERYTDTTSANHTGNLRELYWVIPVDPNGMDTPYGTTSRWEFVLRGAFNAAEVSCLGNCVPYEVQYDMTVIASARELPEEAYDPVLEW